MLDLGQNFVDMFRALHDTNTRLVHIAPTPLTVSTMTISGVLLMADEMATWDHEAWAAANAERKAKPKLKSRPTDDHAKVRVPILAVMAKIVEAGGSAGAISLPPVKPARAASTGTKKTKTSKTASAPKRVKGKAADFCRGSQITLNSKRLSIKLFANGSVHVTGCRSVVQFVEAVDTLITEISTLLGEPPLCLVDGSIGLLNTAFGLFANGAERKLPLAVLRAQFAADGFVASFDVDQYPGILLDIPSSGPKCIKVMIFGTGKINITAGVTPGQTAIAYNTVCTTIDRLMGTLTAPLPVLKKAVKRAKETVIEEYDIIDGYSARIANLWAGVE